MNSISPELMLSMLLSTSLKKIIVPTDFHAQAQAVKEIMRNDSTGLVDSLTDFAVNTANVNFTLDTDNDNLNETLNKWLEKINIEYLGQVPPGIKALAKEYFIERWKGSSFPILKIMKWGQIDGIILPTKMFFIDGGSVYADDRNKKEDNLKLLNYDYYIGKGTNKKNKLNTEDKNVLITKPYGRWFDAYPSNFIVKRGVYHNWKLIQLLKDNQSQVLSQIIPYMMLIKRGSDVLAKENIKTYDDTDFKKIIASIEKMVQTFNDSGEGTKGNKSMMRATQFDETIDHLIPDLKTIFQEELFSGLERNILSGMGYIDIVSAVSSSRKESVVNPKVFIEEVKQGVEDFKSTILTPLIYLIQQKNASHAKYMTNLKVNVSSSPVKGFLGIEFKKEIQRLWRAGRLSDQTAVEMVAEIDFETEVLRKKKEAKRGLDATFYPPLTDNREGTGIDIPSTNPKKEFDGNGNEITIEKTDPIEKEEFNNASVTGEGVTSNNNDHSHKYIIDEIGDGQTDIIDNHSHIIFGGEIEEAKEHNHIPLNQVTLDQEQEVKEDKKEEPEETLEGAPYRTIKELPKGIKDSMGKDLQSTFITVFNRVFNQDGSEDKSFKISWSVIKQIARLNKKGIWVRKRKRQNGKLQPIVMNQSILEKAILKTEKEIADSTLKQIQLENAKDRSKLLKGLNKQKDEEK